MLHRIDDLAHPRLPLPIRALNAAAAPFASQLLPLDEAGLLAAARRRERLEDFGDPSFREPLGVLLSALEREAELSPLGRFGARQLLGGLLATRLRLAELLARHPEIQDEVIEAPIVILGQPRTGTTHLHNLLSALPGLRSLPYWESLEPIPSAAVLSGAAPDLRRRRCAQALRFQHYLAPLFPALHEMTADAAHEEIQLLAVHFSTVLFEATYQVPSYLEWYRRTDQTGAYRTLRRMLQVLQWLRAPKRWVLKSPQHLEQLRPLLAVFPDARIVQTHRDPVRVTASSCMLIAYLRRIGCSRIDVAEIGRYWAARNEEMLRASLRDRDTIPRDQVLDVHFHAFMADEIGAALRVCRFAGLPTGAETQGRLKAYQEANPRGRHGSIDYRLEDFGLDVAERRRALRFYSERFGVADE